MKPEKKYQNEIFEHIGGRPDVRIFRNNVGQAVHKDGSIVRYGVCNPGGSDLIGWTCRTITPDMVGKRIAVFTAVEIKRPGKKPTDPQKNFIKAVLEFGGLAGVATSKAEADQIVDRRPEKE